MLCFHVSRQTMLKIESISTDRAAEVPCALSMDSAKMSCKVARLGEGFATMLAFK